MKMTKVNGKVMLELDIECVVNWSEEDFLENETMIMDDLLDSYINFGLFLDSAKVLDYTTTSTEEITEVY